MALAAPFDNTTVAGKSVSPACGLLVLSRRASTWETRPAAGGESADARARGEAEQTLGVGSHKCLR